MIARALALLAVLHAASAIYEDQAGEIDWYLPACARPFLLAPSGAEGMPRVRGQGWRPALLGALHSGGRRFSPWR